MKIKKLQLKKTVIEKLNGDNMSNVLGGMAPATIESQCSDCGNGTKPISFMWWCKTKKLC